MRLIPSQPARERIVRAQQVASASSPHHVGGPGDDGYPMVLVCLAGIDVAELTELVTDAWLARAPKKLVRELLVGSS
jgi:hypothetical protein